MKSAKRNPAQELIAQLADNKNTGSNEGELSHLSQMLMFRFLSEVEKIAEDRGVTRKQLAEKIEVSPSYLTQVFRGNKPLNFKTLAKIEYGLNLRFDVSAISPEVLELSDWDVETWDDNNVNHLVGKFQSKGLWLFRARKNRTDITSRSSSETFEFSSLPNTAAL